LRSEIPGQASFRGKHFRAATVTTPRAAHRMLWG
jgi:hypothetical protein